MLERLHELAERRESFAFETTLAARTYASWLKSLRDSGYYVRMVYMWLPKPDLNVARVALRVRTGGHDVPEATIRQRYLRSLQNFVNLYRPIVDEWQLYDNSPKLGLELIAESRPDGEQVYDPIRWDLFLRSSGNA